MQISTLSIKKESLIWINKWMEVRSKYKQILKSKLLFNKLEEISYYSFMIFIHLYPFISIYIHSYF